MPARDFDVRPQKLHGVIGAHRVGKTTLCTHMEEIHPEVKFARVSVSQVFKDRGVDLRNITSLEQRIELQEAVFDYYTGLVERIVRESQDYPVILFDRTPLDLVAYTIADITGHNCQTLDGRTSDRYLTYVNRCLDYTFEKFSSVTRVQPGIQIVDDPKSAAPEPAYIEHLNLIFGGLTTELSDRRWRKQDLASCKVHTLDRSVTDLQERVKILTAITLSDVHLKG